jgi:hypothetical protein
MTFKRSLAAGAAAFVVAQVLAILIHGFILGADYKPFYGTLLRPMSPEGDWRMLLLPLTHLCLISALVWIYPRLSITGTKLARGLKIGLLGYIAGQLPLYLLWYAEQPWPDTLVVKQLCLELIASLLVGVTIGLTSGLADAVPMTARPTARGATAAVSG